MYEWSHSEELTARVDSNEEGVQQNSQLMSNAVEHANQLAQNAMALEDQINSAKEPAKQTLEAANAFSNIADSVNAAIESSNAALAKADELTQVVRKHIQILHNIYFHRSRKGCLFSDQVNWFILWDDNAGRPTFFGSALHKIILLFSYLLPLPFLNLMFFLGKGTSPQYI